MKILNNLGVYHGNLNINNLHLFYNFQTLIPKFRIKISDLYKCGTDTYF